MKFRRRCAVPITSYKPKSPSASFGRFDSFKTIFFFEQKYLPIFLNNNILKNIFINHNLIFNPINLLDSIHFINSLLDSFNATNAIHWIQSVWFNAIQCSNQVPTIVYQSALNGKLQHLHGTVVQTTTDNDLPSSTKLSGTASISGVPTGSNGNSPGAPLSSIGRSSVSSSVSNSSAYNLSVGNSSVGSSSVGNSSGGSSLASFSGLPLGRSSATGHPTPNHTNGRKNGTANKMNLLDYYPDTHGDGIHLTWDHAVNSQSLLEQSLSCKSPFVASVVFRFYYISMVYFFRLLFVLRQYISGTSVIRTGSINGSNHRERLVVTVGITANTTCLVNSSYQLSQSNHLKCLPLNTFSSA